MAMMAKGSSEANWCFCATISRTDSRVSATIASIALENFRVASITSIVPLRSSPAIWDQSSSHLEGDRGVAANTGQQIRRAGKGGRQRSTCPSQGAGSVSPRPGRRIFPGRR